MAIVIDFNGVTDAIESVQKFVRGLGDEFYILIQSDSVSVLKKTEEENDRASGIPE